MSDEIKALVERLVEPWESTGEPVVKKINRRLKTMKEAAVTLTAQADEIERLRGELRRIAEGNLGDASWQANYEKIRDVARAAQEVKP